MCKKLSTFILVTASFTILHCNKAIFDELTYQDIIINNQCVQKGERSCAPTYEIIKNILDKIQKPFNVLDIGAAQGYFSFKIAYNYNAICVMLGGDYDYKDHTKQLFKLCKLNNLTNTIFLKINISPNLLRELASREHFDVVLALNFIHHCGCDWKETIDAVMMLGNTIIIEHPPYDEFQNPSDRDWIQRASITNYLQQIGARVIGEVPRHTSLIKKSTIYLLQKGIPTAHSLSIKLSTFTNFGGVYPLQYRQQIKYF